MNKISFLLIDYLKHALRAFFAFLNGGGSCVVCGNKTGVYMICKKCLKEKFSADFILGIRRCRICGKELLTDEDFCSECREKPVLKHIDKMIPLESYRLWNKELLFLWKINSVRSMSRLFARVLSDCLFKLGIKVIVPVPPRPNKIKENGWDQIDELCSYLKYKYGFCVLDILERKSVEQQKKLNREERLNSIGKAYFMKNEERVAEILKKAGLKRLDEVCLVDDVFTTGATLESCSKILKDRGVERVFAVTLFIVD